MKQYFSNLAPTSCQEALKANDFKHGTYTIFPKGGMLSIKVVCKLNTKSQAQTEVSHNMTDYDFVTGYENRVDGKIIKLAYAEPLSKLIMLVQLAKVCWQKIYFKDCNQVGILNWSFLLDRDGKELSFQDSECHCRAFEACYDDGREILLVGNVTSKTKLPLTGVSVGDTGHSGEDTSVLIGSLECL